MLYQESAMTLRTQFVRQIETARLSSVVFLPPSCLPVIDPGTADARSQIGAFGMLLPAAYYSY